METRLKGGLSMKLLDLDLAACCYGSSVCHNPSNPHAHHTHSHMEIGHMYSTFFSFGSANWTNIIIY